MPPRLLLREILVALFFVAASIAMTWPLAAHLASAISDPGDPYYSMAILEWDLRSTLHHPTRLFHHPIFHPTPYTLAFTEHLYGIALPLLPLYLLGVPIIALYNIALLLGFVLCGYGAYVMGRMITGSVAAGIAGGLFFAFLPYRITQIPHISYVWAGWLPLMLAALLWYDQRPSRRRAALVGAAFFLTGLTCMTWLAMGTVALAASVAFLWIIRAQDRRYPVRIALAIVVAIIVLMPFLLPYGTARKMYGMRRSAEETLIGSAAVRDWFVSEPYLPYGRILSDGSVSAERWLFPGIVPLLLAAVGLLLPVARSALPVADGQRATGNAQPSQRLLLTLDLLVVVTAIWSLLELTAKEAVAHRMGSTLLRLGGSPLPVVLCLLLLLTRLCLRLPGNANRSLITSIRESRYDPAVWVSILWLLIGLLGSFGLHGFFHTFLFDYVRAFRSIRVPARWSMIAYVGIAVLISCGVAALERRWRKRPLIAGALACALLVAELSPAPRRWYLANSTTPPVYLWLRQAPVRGAVLELPVATDGSEYAYMRWVPLHRRIMANGISSFIPRSFEHLGAMAHQNPIGDDFLKRLEDIRCSVIVVHADTLGPYDRTTREWLARQIRSGRLTFVRRFPHDQRGDYVFALTRIEPEATFWRKPEVPDRSGQTPLVHLQTFLSGNGTTFFDATVAALDPLSHWDALGELEINGWALSPRGILGVNLRFHNGAVVVPAERYARPEISGSLYPWYPETPLAGYRIRFENRPEWAREDAEMQVEVIDGVGRQHLLDPIFFSWRDRDDFRRRDWDGNELRALLYRLYRRRDNVQFRRADKTGLTAAEIIHSLVKQGRTQPDHEFIDRCYRVLFDRTVDELGLNTYLEALRKGAKRNEVVRTLLRSSEFRQRYFHR